MIRAQPAPASLRDLRAALFLSALSVLLLFDLFWLTGKHGAAALPSMLFGALILGLPWMCAEVLALGAPGRLRQGLASLVFFAPLYVLLVMELSHTYFFDEALGRRISFLDVSFASLRYLLVHVVPRKGLWLLGALVLALHGLAYVLTRASARLLPRLAARSYAGLALGLVVGLCLGGAPHSPWLETARDLLELRGQKLVTFDARTPLPGPVTLLDKSAFTRPAGPLAYDRVLVFVMETMWPHKFESEMPALAPDTFVRAARAHVHELTRYYTTNQDSRTSVLGLLGSRFVPEQAYTEEGRDRYLHLERESSLVDVFQGLGFETAFAAAQGELELVVGDLRWQHRLMLEPEQLATAAKKYLCFNPYEFEHSCEDKALLPEIFALLDQPKRVFLVQQMMWGHASEYNRASGKTNTRYYSEYLDLVVAHLKERGLLERTLIVLTADHGFREKDHQLVPDVYRVPLWFYQPGFAARQSDGLYSHLDFKELLLRELGGVQNLPPENPFLLIVGTTGSSLLAVVNRREMFVIKDRPFASYLLPGGHRALDGRPIERTDSDLGGYLKLFHTYRNQFGPAP